MSSARLVLVSLTLILLAACGAAEPPATAGDATAPPSAPADDDAAEHGMDAHGGSESTDFAFGQPAEASAADRTVTIRTGNDLTFDPAEVSVTPGETVTFAISNDGDIPHDFVIGDDAAQRAHAEEMAAMTSEMAMEGEQHGDANAVSVPPGQTAQLTWTFDGATDGLVYGCHEPGHYEAGMVGDIVIGQR